MGGFLFGLVLSRWFSWRWAGAQAGLAPTCPALISPLLPFPSCLIHVLHLTVSLGPVGCAGGFYLYVSLLYECAWVGSCVAGFERVILYYPGPPLSIPVLRSVVFVSPLWQRRYDVSSFEGEDVVLMRACRVAGALVDLIAYWERIGLGRYRASNKKTWVFSLLATTTLGRQ